MRKLKTKKELNRTRQVYRSTKDFGLYKKFKAMRRRCTLKSGDHYKWYGAKGITVEWPSYVSFRTDMMDSYLRHIEQWGKDQTTIERIDNNKGYSKANCTWATPRQQHFNQGGRGRIKI